MRESTKKLKAVIKDANIKRYGTVHHNTTHLSDVSRPSGRTTFYNGSFVFVYGVTSEQVGIIRDHCWNAYGESTDISFDISHHSDDGACVIIRTSLEL